jgi:hypothetical protein
MKITVVVRDIGSLKPDYSMDFDVPAVPSIGSYISVHRPDAEHGHTEDLFVRRVWWRLEYPDTSGYGSNPPKIGLLGDIQVECEQAIGPNSLDRWRKQLEQARSQGVQVEEFEIARMNVTEAEFAAMKQGKV